MKAHHLNAGITLAALLSFSSFSANHSLSGCQAKEHNIKQEISQAKALGNQNRVAGLEKALKEAKANCIDSALHIKRQQNIDEKQHKVQELEREVQEAKQSGKADKISRKTAKLEEARHELKQAQAELRH
ncbi:MULTISPECIES: DUF1090 domain-containing protein [Lonsdalea]|uniref:Uncharacterized protein n=2 Tax=Lonsdalea TaxID=1082702 RepID=A0ACD1J960_9GAMM|nr:MULTISPECIES: DUF1090 domain-containing protein [Lonsdalea]OSM94824.1 hypothetical protein AU508_12740 [Lonsdalea populi]OSM99404.1 hypothetical protein AU499_11950 [Lonsdalea populi]QPQ23721.1 DUF1090 domain-containing protein [Lonsdalea populi]RAT10738.1 hypothetical protein AU485_15875 [Lonsdalea quercina]RAT14162.1 hypothetical protein AU486_13265 [Lonsdalea quercina]